MKELTWDDYYSRFWDLAPSTRRSYCYRLSEFGPADEVLELVNEFALEGDGFATKFVSRAVNAGVRFTPEQVMELTILVDRGTLGTVAQTADGTFDRGQLEELDGLIDSDAFDRIAEKANIDMLDTDPEEYAEPEDADEPVDFVYEKPVRKGPGFWAGLLAIFGTLALSGGKKDSGRCDGDCANCPAHYGYRYGRRYYGHGHQRGCERGGNGGASGRTYRD